MSSQSKGCFVFVLALVLLVPCVRASTQYWDTASSAGLQGGAGVWSTNIANWSDTGAGTVLSAWTPGNVAAFSVSSNSVPSVVTVTERFNVGRVTNFGSGYTLIITNGGGLLQGSGSSCIGANTTNNTVIVVGGPGGVSTWEVGSAGVTQDLTIGSGAAGSNNLLLIDGAGTVNGAIITNAAVVRVTSSRLVVTNGGGLYASSVLAVFGTNSSLVVAKGGSATFAGASQSKLGVAANELNNSWLVTDPGSVLAINSPYINVISSGSRIIVSNGASLLNAGYFKFDSTTANNEVTVTGPGSFLSVVNASGQQLSGTNNTFTISNGGAVLDSVMKVGDGGGAISNVLTVTGSGSVLTNTGNAGGIAGLILGNGSSSNGSHRAIITAGGAVINTTSGTALGYNGGHSNSLVVMGSGSLLTNSGAVSLGLNGPTFSSSYNTMTVASSGHVFSTTGLIGAYTGSFNNVVTVTDPVSLWQMSGALSLGSQRRSDGNQLVVTNGGTVNAMAVTIGSGTSMFNSVMITTAGTVNSSGAVNIGVAAASSSNSAWVSGSGALWDVGGKVLTIGASTSTGNVLTVTQGGTIDNVGTLVVVTNNAVNLLGGTLGVKTLAFTNGLFTVGDGVQSATLKSLAGGTLNFSNGLLISTNASLNVLGTVSASSIVLNTNAMLIGVGTVGGITAGVIVSNGASFAPGVSGPSAGLTISDGGLTWGNGGIYRCEITNVSLGAGLGWDLLNVTNQLVLNGSNLVIRLDSMGAQAGNFNPAMNYSLRILNYGSVVGFDATHFVLDTNAFWGGTTNWTVASLNGALYLQYHGSSTTYVPTTGLTWMLPSNGVWSTGANWSGGTPPSVGDVAAALEFGGSGTGYASTNDLGVFALNKLLLTSTSGSSVTNLIAGGTLVFTNADARVDYTGSGSYVISNALLLANNTVFGGQGAGTVILAKNITGGMPLVKQGPWTLALQGTNNFANPVVVSDGADGIVRMDNNNAFGTNSLVVTNAGTFLNTSSFTLGNRAALCTALVTGNGSLWTNEGSVTVGSNATVTVADGGRLNSKGFTVNNTYGLAPCGLLITNGGVFVSTNAFNFGTSSSSNLLRITGNGSLFLGPGDVIGGGSWPAFGAAIYTNNTIWIENGGVFTNARINLNGVSVAVITNGGSCYSTTISILNSSMVSVIGGPAVTSLVNVAGPLNVNGNGARLTVEGMDTLNSASVIVNSISLGVVNNNGNRVLVKNKGSLVEGANLGTVTIGGTGSTNNGFEVIQGGYAKFTGGVAAGQGIGLGDGSRDNYLLVDGAGSLLEMSLGSFFFEIGYFTTTANNMNSGNMLLVRNNGVVSNAAIRIAGYSNLGDKATNCCNNGVLVSSTGRVYMARDCQIGFNAGVTGNFVKVTDSGSYWNMGNRTLTIGHSNGLGLSTNNYLMIMQAGTMENVGNLNVYSNNQAYLYGGTLGLINAAISNGLDFVVGDGVQTATLKLQGGTLNFGAGLTITNHATLTGAGTIRDTMTTVYGTVSPGTAGIGALTNSGTLTLQSGAVSTFEIGANTTPGVGWDYLLVTDGTLTLNGSLKPVLTGGLTPLVTDSYVIMSNSVPLVGAFGNSGSGWVSVTASNSAQIVGSFQVVIGNQYVALEGFTIIPKGSWYLIK